MANFDDMRKMFGGKHDSWMSDWREKTNAEYAYKDQHKLELEARQARQLHPNMVINVCPHQKEAWDKWDSQSRWDRNYWNRPARECRSCKNKRLSHLSASGYRICPSCNGKGCLTYTKDSGSQRYTRTDPALECRICEGKGAVRHGVPTPKDPLQEYPAKEPEEEN